MAVSNAQIAKLRRMVAEPDAETYSDEDIGEYIESYPRTDERGEVPYTFDTSTEPPTQEANPQWIPTYDLHAAAAAIWEEKAAALANSSYDFSADGGQFNRSQLYKHALEQAAKHQARTSIEVIELNPSPGDESGDDTYIGNLAE